MALTEDFNNLWESRDLRVDDWKFMGSTRPAVIAVTFYLAVVYIGPKLMANRKPFKLTSSMILYNTFISLINLLVVVQYLIGTFNRKTIWTCYIDDSKSTDYADIKIAKTAYLLATLKIIEWADTVFFILRKKHNQLTFTHVYHHSVTFLFGWIITRWIPTDASYMSGMFNAAVHIFIYGYYSLAALGPNVQRYLWWKKYITMLEMIQFVVGVIIEAATLIYGCSSHPWIHWLFCLYMISLLFMFMNFYRHTYPQKIKFRLN
ncbi:hypothetical protein CHUAL_003778 [Chamberlinius hualienensis]